MSNKTRKAKKARAAQRRAQKAEKNQLLAHIRKGIEEDMALYREGLPPEVVRWIAEEAWKFASEEERQAIQDKYPGDWIRMACRYGEYPSGWAGEVCRKALSWGFVNGAIQVGTMIRLGKTPENSRDLIQDLLSGKDPDLGPGVNWARNLSEHQRNLLHQHLFDRCERLSEDLRWLRDPENPFQEDSLLRFCYDLDIIASLRNVLRHAEEEDFIRESFGELFTETEDYLRGLERPVFQDERLERAALCCPLSFWALPALSSDEEILVSENEE